MKTGEIEASRAMRTDDWAISPYRCSKLHDSSVAVLGAVLRVLWGGFPLWRVSTSLQRFRRETTAGGLRE
jgi:hypothetical protein